MPWYFAAHGVLLGAMLLAWRRARADPGSLPLALGAALLFRIVATAGVPALSDDVYRYVWDGRVQLAGIHPYVHAPVDPALAALRDGDWAKINHPELRTIYPPLAQMVFAALAGLGLGPRGFRLFFGFADFGVVLALAWLARRLNLPRERVLLYAWNPLAVIESAGSGHIEPLGVLLVLATLGASAWRAGAALAAAVQVKLVPLLLFPGLWRRQGSGAGLAFVATVGLLWLPYALTGPAIGSGTFDYARRWEHNAFLYAGVEGLVHQLPWEAVEHWIWPRGIARIVVSLCLLLWTLYVTQRLRPDPLHEALLVFGGALLLAPTVHPWYALWVLPFAALAFSPGWLLFAALVPLAYWAPAGDVPWAVRLLEYAPPLALMALARSRR